MTRWTRPASAALLLFLPCVAPAAGPGPEPNPDATAGVSKATFDASVRAQDDLFRHVNGGWIASATIPPERPLYGAFIQLAEKAEGEVRAIIEESSKKADDAPGAESQKVGDLYASFMDEGRVDSLGLKPIEDDLSAVDALKDKAAFAKLLGDLQRRGLASVFDAGVSTDAKQSDRYVVYLDQGGLGLPDESYYREETFKDTRTAYLAHVEAMFKLAGAADPKASAEKVVTLETRLAKAHWDRVKRRDRTLTYNKKDLKALAELTPGFDWPAWMASAKVDGVTEVIVQEPDFFTAMAKALDDVPLDDWKLWLKWKVLHEAAPFLSKPFVDENFAFYGKTLTGAPEIRPRWKRGVELVGQALGEAVGKIYVEKHFPPASKARMEALVKNLTDAYREDIASLEWMSPETRAKALEKLAKFTPKIAYPGKWRDYAKMEVRRDDLMGNVERAAAFEHDRGVAKLGKPVDKGEWFMTPQTVNAYYNPGLNEIVFPAAILQPPFFDPEADDAVNYGAIGAVIGHEIGHGFDDQGSKSDGDGNMVNWWTDADRKEFDARSKALTEQYNGFETKQLPGMKVNGALTIGENIGDLGGLTIANKAYKRSLRGSEAPTIDGLTGDQRFFIGWAQVWRIKYRDAELKRRLTIDPHSPGEFRCNGVVRNLPEFYSAFGVKEGDKLYLAPDQRVRIW